MPTYDYRCTRCGHEFEEFQSMTAPRLRTCPACKGKTLERLIGTGAGVIFKGGGFYETDYRSDAYRKAAEAEAKAGSGTESVASKSQGGKNEPAAPSQPADAPTTQSTKKPSKKPDPGKATTMTTPKPSDQKPSKSADAPKPADDAPATPRNRAERRAASSSGKGAAPGKSGGFPGSGGFSRGGPAPRRGGSGKPPRRTP